MSMIRVLLVDDQPWVLRGLRMRLELEPDLEVVGEASDGDAALELAGRLHPDVVLMDVAMPGRDGIAATRALRASREPSQVVLLTLHDDCETRARAQSSGAVAFVGKHEASEILLQAIREAAQPSL
ncbi:MAG: response regulator transcription factor [Chloroflexi bacterium]|nr:response regulator transcription factor [Chloroflexota bacterium]